LGARTESRNDLWRERNALDVADLDEAMGLPLLSSDHKDVRVQVALVLLREPRRHPVRGDVWLWSRL
jgi:hypothetical protein